MLMIILVLLALVNVSCRNKKKTRDGLDIITLTLDWTPNTNHTGLYVARELGYFKEEGLEVVIQQPTEGMTDNIVANGSSEFGISYQENVTRARSESIPIVSIAAIIQHNTSGFASLKQSNIKTPKDFEGKRYGSWDSPSEHDILKTIMKSYNADIEKVTIISGINDFFSTIGKDADFEWIFYAWDGIKAEIDGIDINYLPLRDLHPVFDYYTPVIITTEKLMQEKPELISRFMRAVSKGYRYCIDNPEKAAEVMIRQVPDLDPELVRQSQIYLAREYQAEASKWGIQNEAVWSAFANWMHHNGLIKDNIIPKNAFTSQFLP